MFLANTAEEMEFRERLYTATDVQIRQEILVEATVAKIQGGEEESGTLYVLARVASCHVARVSANLKLRRRICIVPLRRRQNLIKPLVHTDRRGSFTPWRAISVLRGVTQKRNVPLNLSLHTCLTI